MTFLLCVLCVLCGWALLRFVAWFTDHPAVDISCTCGEFVQHKVYVLDDNDAALLRIQADAMCPRCSAQQDRRLARARMRQHRRLMTSGRPPLHGKEVA